jgi:hypothetical protein
MQETEDNIESLGTVTPSERQETRAMAMVAVETEVQVQVQGQQGKTSDNKIVLIDVEETEKEKVERKEMASRSDMWQHFIKIKDDKGFLKTGKCKYCHREIKADPVAHGTCGCYSLLLNVTV